VYGELPFDAVEFIENLKKQGKTEKDGSFMAGLTNFSGDQIFMFFNVERLNFKGFANRVLPHEALHLSRYLISLYKNKWMRENLNTPNWWEDKRATFTELNDDNEEFFAETLERTTAIAMDGWFRATGSRCLADGGNIGLFEDGGERLVGSFYYDTRKDKTFRVISFDRTDIGIQYYENNKQPIGKIETIDKDTFDYYVSMGAWNKYKQSYFKEGGETDGDDGDYYAKGGGVKGMKLPKDAKIRINYVDVSVYKDSYEEGETDNVNNYDMNHIKGSIVSPKELVSFLAENIYTSEDASDYSILDNNIHTSQLQDADGSEASESEIERWKKGDLELYSARFIISVSIISEIEFDEEVLSSLTGIGVYKKGGNVKSNFAKGGGVGYYNGMTKEDIISKSVVYDNPETFDRYTIFTPDGSVFGMSENASGFNQYVGEDSEIQKGKHLGIKLKSVPTGIEWAILDRMKEEYADGGGVDDFKMSYDEMTTYEKSNHIHYNPMNSRWEVTKNGENKEFWNQEQAEKYAGFEFDNDKDSRYSRKKYEALFGYAKGGRVNKMDRLVENEFYIFEGIDHYSSTPLFRVESTSDSDAEYIGEWHTDRNEAEKELRELNGSSFEEDIYSNVDEELIRDSAEEIYNEQGFMNFRNLFLKLADTDERSGDIETANFRRALVKEYQDKQPRIK
jgi:hypothetical protein